MIIMKFVTILISLFLITPVFAETIVLKSGKSIEGKIIEDTDQYIKLETGDGQLLYFYKNTIDSIKSANEGLNPVTSAGSTMSTGLLDYSNKGYMLFIPKNISSLSSVPIIICLPGSGIKTKQDINNWSFSGGKKGFIILGLDIDYNKISSFSEVEGLYSKIINVIDSLAKQYPINKNKLYIAGTSAGGMMSIALALRYPNSFMAIGVVSGGRLSFGAKEELGRAKGCRFYMIHGDKDERIPIGEFQSTRKLLEKNGALIEYKVVAAGRHTLGSNYYKEVVDWFSNLEDLTTVR